MIEDRRKGHNLDQCHLCVTDWVSHQMKWIGKRDFAVYPLLSPGTLCKYIQRDIWRDLVARYPPLSELFISTWTQNMEIFQDKCITRHPKVQRPECWHDHTSSWYRIQKKWEGQKKPNPQNFLNYLYHSFILQNTLRFYKGSKSFRQSLTWKEGRARTNFTFLIEIFHFTFSFYKTGYLLLKIRSNRQNRQGDALEICQCCQGYEGVF